MRIANAYYHTGGVNVHGWVETPFLLDKKGEKTFFLIRCSACHVGLCKAMEIARIVNDEQLEQNIIFIEPCRICLEAARRHVDPPVIPLGGPGSRTEGLEFIYED